MVDALIQKIGDFDLLTQKEKVKYISYFHCVSNMTEAFGPSDVDDYFDQLFLEKPSNIPRELLALASGKPPVLLKKGNKYSFQRSAKKQLDDIFFENKHTVETSTMLRALIPKTKTQEQRQFLEEAITCLEVKTFRASIIMTWLLTMDVLFEYVISSRLQDFNDELKKRNKKKFVSCKSDFEEFKESEIIEVMKSSGIISKEQRKLLDEKLDIRNSAAHPNSTTFREIKVVTYIQEVVEEIVFKYQ